MIRFDRTAPGEGMVIYSRVENGKAYLQFQFFWKCREPEYMVCINVTDVSDKSVLQIDYPVQEEEPAKGLLLHPHLWRGVADPHVYSVKAALVSRENPHTVIDVVEAKLPLRSLEEIPQKGWFLNGEKIELRAVGYTLPSAQEPRQMRQNLQLLKAMGANMICLDYAEANTEICALCDELGLLVWYGGNCRRMFDGQGKLLSEEQYYYYKARWSSEPFVHLVKSSLKRQENGNYSLMVYSNQNRVALYVDGVLFEFQGGAPEFHFEEIPGSKYPLQLTAEAGECRISVTLY